MRLATLMMAVVCQVGWLGVSFAADPAKDPFAEGSLWVGEAKRAGEDDVARWALTVTERTGKNFKGEVIVRPPKGEVSTIMVQGQAPTTDAGLVAFKTEQKGFAQMSLRGKLQNGEVALLILGTGKLGKAGAGTATLRPKN